MTQAKLPWGPIKSFEAKACDVQHDEASPIQTWISLMMEPEAGHPILMLSLHLRSSHDESEAKEIRQAAQELEDLLRDHVRSVTFQTVE